MDKFCKGKMLDLCFRVSLAVDPEVSFQFLIKVFSLSISLRMISGRGCDGVIEEFGEGMREFQYELWSSI
jgi:hypothetical protein